MALGLARALAPRHGVPFQRSAILFVSLSDEPTLVSLSYTSIYYGEQHVAAIFLTFPVPCPLTTA